jgi:hypothetical protein
VHENFDWDAGCRAHQFRPGTRCPRHRSRHSRRSPGRGCVRGNCVKLLCE